jgi:lysozyme family protein
MANSNLKRGAGAGTAVAAILAAIFSVEGGYSNDSKDPGGETNHGVTVAVARAAGYTGAMKDLTKETASNIYISNYINKPGYGEVITLSPAVGQKLVDAGVNVGPDRSSRWFQTALNSVSRGGKDYPQINVDGKIGPGTVSAYANLQRVRGKGRACELVLKLVDAQQAGHYMSLTKLNQYTPGWVDHRVGNVPLSKCSEDG